MNLDLEIEFSKAPILQEVDALKKQIDDMRPLPVDVEGRIMQKLRLDWNYNSNAIEGNKLSYGETVAFLMEGITAKGKPLKDHLDIRGHNEAILFLTDLVKDPRGISEADIRALHKMILVERYKVDAQTADGKPTTKWVEIGEYKMMPNHVQTATGETHYYATPEEVPAKMQELVEWYQEANSFESIHTVVVAALFHHRFVAIHPFDDGNGRLSRILMNLILMQGGYPPAVVRMDDRKNYYSLLSRADKSDTWPFVEYIGEEVLNSLNIYLKGINGEEIYEDEDIDKRIALFRMELQTKIAPNKRVSLKEVNNIILNGVIPFFEMLPDKFNFFEEIFETVEFEVIFDFVTGNISTDRVKFLLNKTNIYNEINNLLKTARKTKSLNLRINLNKFKKLENEFSVEAGIDIYFEDQDYYITNTYSDFEISKFYNQLPDKKDINIIITNILDRIRDWIDEQLK